MFSPSKKLDKELLLEIGECILAVVKVGTPQAFDLAEEMGLLYSEIETRIAIKDYTQDDYYLERFEQLWQPSTHATPTANATTQLETAK